MRLHHALGRPRRSGRVDDRGDLSENAEYEAANARQELVQVRISQIGGRIRELSLYTMASIPQGVAAYGSRVTVEDLEEGEEIVYHLVFPEEADVAQGRISLGSPLGRALLNRSEGDDIEVQTPKGKRRYQIIDLVTIHEINSKAD